MLKNVKTIAAQLKQYRIFALLSPLLSMMEGIFETLIPFFMAGIIDKGISGGDMGEVTRYGMLTIFIAACSLACGVAAGRVSALASSGVAANVREAMFASIEKYSFSNIDKYSTAGLVTRLTTDVTNLQNAVQMLIRMCARAPVSMFCAFFLAFRISHDLSLIFLVAIIFLGTVLGIIMRSTHSIFSRVFDQYDELNASVQENITAIRVVKSFVREDLEDKKYSAESNRLYGFFVRAESYLACNAPAMFLTVFGCNLALGHFGARHVVAGSLTTGQLMSLFAYVMNILMGLMMLSMVFVMLTMSSASIRRIAEVINETSDLVPASDPVHIVKDGSIDFEHVDFYYLYGKGDPVLTDVSFHIASGETVGIIGSTGSAKSSLVQLIPRLYDVSAGSVKVGGVDVRRYFMPDLRNQVSMVLQKNVLFSGTIMENLRWGDENATEEECRRAAEAACADEFIDRLPDGYNTYIEQGGSNVSGGQKQRLCIARALVKKPKILIMDDSTSAVDTATDARIRKAFKEAIPGTTKIIIAQRISSVQDADKIIVIDSGRIESIGTHEELKKISPIYRQICEAQAEAAGDFDVNRG